MKNHKQQGFVAIIVASVLMVILTLITLGFTEIMRREQRQALDRQLSTQAFYAAESGVNDFFIALQVADERDEEIPKEDYDCDASEFEPVIDQDTGYTCLQYDTDPTTLEYNNGSIETNQSKVIPVYTSDEQPIQSISIGWDHQGGQYGVDDASLDLCANPSPLPPSRSSVLPIMRVDILRLPQTGSTEEFSQEGAIDETPNLYLYPVDDCASAVTAIDYASHSGTGNKGDIILVDCEQSASERDCQLQINMPATTSDRYILRLRSIYANANATIGAVNTSGDTAELKDAQIMVDVTGKANDVLRRIQVRLEALEAADKQYAIPEPVFQAMGTVCKLLTVIPPGSVGSPNGTVNGVEECY